MNVVIKTLTGKEFVIDEIKPFHTIDHIKWKMSRFNDDPVFTNCIKDIRLIYAGKSLEDGRTVTDYNI